MGQKMGHFRVLRRGSPGALTAEVAGYCDHSIRSALAPVDCRHSATEPRHAVHVVRHPAGAMGTCGMPPIKRYSSRWRVRVTAVRGRSGTSGVELNALTGLTGGLLLLDLHSHLGPPGEHRLLRVQPTPVGRDRHVIGGGWANEPALELLDSSG